MLCAPRRWGQPLRRLWAATVGIAIEAEIDGVRAVAQLLKLTGVEMGSQRASDVVKTGLGPSNAVGPALDQSLPPKRNRLNQERRIGRESDPPGAKSRRNQLAKVRLERTGAVVFSQSDAPAQIANLLRSQPVREWTATCP
jgi:hypothetical protein